MTRFVEKSRSQLKREENERQEIALRFVELSPGNVDELPLEESTRRAIHTAQSCRHHVQRRRACLHVATRLREVALEELREIARRIEVGESIRSRSRVRLVDAWAQALVDDETKAIAELREFVPELDVSRVRQLVRNLRRELAEPTGRLRSSSARGPGGPSAPKRDATSGTGAGAARGTEQGATAGAARGTEQGATAGAARGTGQGATAGASSSDETAPGRGVSPRTRRRTPWGVPVVDPDAAAEAVAEWARETNGDEADDAPGGEEGGSQLLGDAVDPRFPAKRTAVELPVSAKRAALLEYLTELRPGADVPPARSGLPAPRSRAEGVSPHGGAESGRE